MGLLSYKTILAGLFLISPSVALAHGIPIVTEKNVGDYTLGFAYDSFEYDIGAPTPIRFTIMNKDTQEEIPFTHVWVRTTKDSEFNIVYSGGIRKADIGVTTMVYGFPGNGSYTFSLSFRNGEETLAEETFPMEVTTIQEPKEVDSNSLPITLQSMLFLIGGLLIGAAGTRIFIKGREKG